MDKRFQDMAMGDAFFPKLLMFIFIISNLMNLQVHGQHDIDWTQVTFLESAVSKGAVCLDGSPAAYHYSKGFGEGANNWMVYLLGGGWCRTKAQCLERKETSFGSTKNVTETYLGGILSQVKSLNPDFYNWNRVVVRYCDGSSFMGDVEEVDPETEIYYRGARIFDAVIEEMLGKGMNKSHNAMLVGTSAGGLAAMLRCDSFRALLPNAVSVKCVSDSGLILLGKGLPDADLREGYFDDVVALHGIAKNLPASCTSKMKPSLCFLPENFLKGVQTPVFLLNSAFDRYQIQSLYRPQSVAVGHLWSNCTLDLNICTPSQLQLMKDFRTMFLKTLREISDSRGVFITSCYIHNFLYYHSRFNEDGIPRLGNKTVAEAIGDWYFDRSIIREIDTGDVNPVNCTHA